MHMGMQKKKNLFCILKYYFIYFTNLFYNLPYIPVLIFTYNPKKYINYLIK